MLMKYHKTCHVTGNNKSDIKLRTLYIFLILYHLQVLRLVADRHSSWTVF